MTLRSSAVSMPELGKPAQQTSSLLSRRSVSKRKLPPGKGLIDWIRLCRTKGKDMTGVGGIRISVTPQMLSEHNTEEDCWTAIRGVVYNITAYLSFHPGSVSELMKGAGIDCTMLFNNAHAHVRVTQTLATCIVGDLVLPPSTSIVLSSSPTLALELSEDSDDDAGSVKTVSPAAVNHTLVPLMEKVSVDESDGTSNQYENDNLNLPSTYRSRRNSRGFRDRPSPSCKLEQTNESVIITVDTQKQLLKTSDVITEMIDESFNVTILLGEWICKLKLALDNEVGQCTVTTNESIAVITLTKKSSIHWNNLDSNPVTKLMIPAGEHSNHFMKSRLHSVTAVSHNTKLFTLELPAESHMVVPTGYHIKIKADNELIRSYTPVLPLTGHAVEGRTINLLIKLYSDGRMSRYLSSLAVGDQVLISRPEGSFSEEQFEAANEIVMLAAGTGFTPMMKLIRQYLSANPHKTCKLLFFNRTANDIYYKQQLDELTASNQNFSVLHILSNADASWQGVRGRVNKELLEEHLPRYCDGQRLFLCGHIEFTQAIINILMEKDYPDECIHAFT